MRLSNWIRFFDSGFYMRGWGFRIDLERTIQEVEGVLNLLKPEPGSHIIDWCGGWGRHAIELAKRGFEVTLLDFCMPHIEEARRRAWGTGVAERMRFVHADFKRTPSSLQADYAINLFTSGLGYLREHDDLKALQSLHRALKPGAKIIIDTMNLFWLARNYQPRGWYQTENGERRLLSEREFDFITGRNLSTDTLYDKGAIEECSLSHRIFSPAELARLLSQAKFKPLSLYGDFDGQEFGFDSRRIIMIAEKR